MRLEEREHVRIEPFVESGAVKLWGVDADFGYDLRKRRPARDQKGEVPGVADDMGFMPRLMGPILPGRLSARRGALDSRETASGCCTATAYSIAPSRSPVVSERAPNGA